MQRIELLQRHAVDEPLHEIRALEIARRVQHQAAPGEPRLILHLQAGDVHGALAQAGRGDLPGGDHTVEQAGVVRRRDGQALRRHVQAVGLALGPRADQTDRPGRGVALAHGQFQTTGPQQEVGEISRIGQGFRIAGRRDDLGGLAEVEDPFARGFTRRRRGDRRQRRGVGAGGEDGRQDCGAQGAWCASARKGGGRAANHGLILDHAPSAGKSGS